MTYIPPALIVSLLFLILAMVILVTVDHLTARARLKALTQLAAMQDRPPIPIKIDERV